jgi:hypothetical protein
MDRLVRLIAFMFFNATSPVGWDVDDYGCNTAAGYSYCNYTDDCLFITDPCN